MVAWTLGPLSADSNVKRRLARQDIGWDIVDEDLLATFGDYEGRVRLYSRTWFTNNIDARELLEKVPVARARAIRLAASNLMVGTEVVYRHGETRWLPQRTSVQAKVLNDFLTVSGAETTEEGVASAMPIAVLLMGLPGSGKSTMLAPVARELIRRVVPSHDMVINADDIRSLVPEYRDGIGSEVVQVETSYLTYARVTEEVLERRGHVILDGVGDPIYSVGDVEFLTLAGWSVVCLCATLDLATAEQRAMKRAVTDGRYVPVSYIRAIGDRPIRAFDAVRKCGVPLIGSARFSTSGAEDEPPTVIEASDESLFGQVGGPTTLWPEPDRGGSK